MRYSLDTNTCIRYLNGRSQSIRDKLPIASIAIVYDLILVTHNTKEFGRISWLKVEDWEI